MEAVRGEEKSAGIPASSDSFVFCLENKLWRVAPCCPIVLRPVFLSLGE